MNHQAIYNLYPNVVSIDDTAGAMDKDGNQVPIVQLRVSTSSLRVHFPRELLQNRRMKSRLWQV